MGEFIGGTVFGTFPQRLQSQGACPRPGLDPGPFPEAHRGEEKRRFAVRNQDHVQAIGKHVPLRGYMGDFRSRAADGWSRGKFRGARPCGFVPGCLGKRLRRQLDTRPRLVREPPLGQYPHSGAPFRRQVAGGSPAKVFSRDGLDSRRFTIDPVGVAVQQGRLAEFPRALLHGQASRGGRPPELLLHFLQLAGSRAIALKLGNMAVKGAEYGVPRPAQGVELAEVVPQGMQRPHESRDAVLLQAEILGQEQDT